MRALLLGALAALSLAGGAAGWQQYCDGSGGLQAAARGYSDPSCAGDCTGCSAAQVLAAMAAAPGDGDVQKYGCWALAIQATDSPASRAAIAGAGGIEAVTGAMARFPDDSNVQSNGCHALSNLAIDSPANRAAIADAGGIDAVTGAMARFPDDSNVQGQCPAANDSIRRTGTQSWPLKEALIFIVIAVAAVCARSWRDSQKNRLRLELGAQLMAATNADIDSDIEAAQSAPEKWLPAQHLIPHLKCWAGSHFVFELFHLFSCFFIWDFLGGTWPKIYELFSATWCSQALAQLGLTTTISEALDAEDAQICGIVDGLDSAITLYLNGPTMMLVSLIVGGTALMITIVAPHGEDWQYKCYSGANAAAIFLNVCVNLYVYILYNNLMQVLCDAGREEYCDDYEHPAQPPPSSSGGGLSASDVWDMATDKADAKVLWVLFTHIALTVFRPAAIFVVCAKNNATKHRRIGESGALGLVTAAADGVAQTPEAANAESAPPQRTLNPTADIDASLAAPAVAAVPETPEMAVSRPLPGDDEQTFEFEEEGGLGITFDKHDACEPGSELRARLIIVLDVVADSAAARIAALRAGLVLSSVQDQPVAGLGFKATMGLIKAAGRPLRLGFAMDDDGALRTVPSAELEQTQAAASAGYAEDTNSKADGAV